MKTKIAMILNAMAPVFYGLACSFSVQQFNTKGYIVAAIIAVLFINRLLNNHHKVDIDEL